MPPLPWLLLLLLLITPSLHAAKLTAIELVGTGEVRTILARTEGASGYRLFTLDNPPRIVLDLEQTSLGGKLPAAGLPEAGITRIRSGLRDGGESLRVVFDLERPLTTDRGRQTGEGVEIAITLPAESGSSKSRARNEQPARPVATVDQIAARNRLRDVTIAIDAGHGGKDVGAEGPSGIYEKDVVLSVARRLERLLERERGMRPFMVRDGDHFLRLRQRIEKARKAEADLFLSLHANSFSDASVRGSSVYVLSNRGATSEAARWLARKENEADLIGGVSIEEQEETIGAVLLDLAQNATLDDSIAAADAMLGQLRRHGKVHKRRVERAGFMVLKSPDMPSVLIELAFISNPGEERKLASARYQQRLAEALLGGVRSYFSNHAPPGTLLSVRKHRVSDGETLSGLAERYRLPIEQLRRANQLSGDRLAAGVELAIPGKIQ
jgi:N-acetylmuramoyl-L-alanine amidase